MDDPCRRRIGIRQLILTGELKSDSPVNSIPYIGTVLRTQFLTHNITNVSSLITDIRSTYDQPNGRQNKIRAVKSRLEELAENPRANRCVNMPRRRSRRIATRRNARRRLPLSAGNTSLPYQVADINICAYNSLLHLLRGLRDPTIREKLNIVQTDWNWVANLKYRRRGTLQASRYCSCLMTEGTCRNRSECAWTADQMCIPRVSRLSARYGFEGVGEGNAQCNRRRWTDEKYYRGWRVPE